MSLCAQSEETGKVNALLSEKEFNEPIDVLLELDGEIEEELVLKEEMETQKEDGAVRKKTNPINKSFVYLHSYAGCRVYESLYNQVAVQRRIDDSYMNASAILKVFQH